MNRLVQLTALFFMLGSLTANSANLPGLRFLPADNEPLKMKLDYSKSSAIPGGVAFSEVAQLFENQELVSFHYDQTRQDGSRLILTIENAKGAGSEISPTIYDWQLAPLVAFVNDAEHDCLVNFQGQGRLFGELRFQYHPAIESELLGMRLWQADFMLFNMLSPSGRQSNSLDGSIADLPTDEDTLDYILGAGETAPDVARNRKRINEVRQELEKLDVDVPTYVICDKGQTVKFGAVNGRFSISGSPIWWLRSYGKAGEVKPHDELSDKLTQLMAKDGGMNPTVYRSVVVAMRYSALLRCLKKASPVQWASLVKTVENSAKGIIEKAPVLILVEPKLSGAE